MICPQVTHNRLLANRKMTDDFYFDDRHCDNDKCRVPTAVLASSQPNWHERHCKLVTASNLTYLKKIKHL